MSTVEKGGVFSRYRRLPSSTELLVIVFLDVLASCMVSALVTDRQIGFFNSDYGDQCIGSADKSPECKSAMHETEIVSGWSAAVSALFAFVLSPLLGSVSDSYGRIPLLLIVMIVSTLLPTIFLVISVYWNLTLWLYIAWKSVVYGFSSIAIAFAYIADIAAGRERTEQFGVCMAAFSAASVIGPLAATYLTLSEGVVYIIAAGCSLIGCTYTLFFLGESLSLELQHSKRSEILRDRATAAHAALDCVAADGIIVARAQLQNAPMEEPLLTDQQNGTQPARVVVSSETTIVRVSSVAAETTDDDVDSQPEFLCQYAFSNPLKSVLILNRNNLLRCLAVIILLLVLVVFGQLGISYLYLHSRFGMDQKQHAILSVVQGCSGVLIQSIGLRMLLRYLSNKSVMIFGLAFLALSNVLYGVMWTEPLAYAIAPIASLGMLSFPAITSLKSGALGPEEQGAIQGALSAVRSIGGGLGPLMFNQLLSATQDTSYVATPFYVGAVLSIVALAIAIPVDEIIYVAPEKIDAKKVASIEDSIDVSCDASLS